MAELSCIKNIPGADPPNMVHFVVTHVCSTCGLIFWLASQRSLFKHCGVKKEKKRTEDFLKRKQSNTGS